MHIFHRICYITLYYRGYTVNNSCLLFGLTMTNLGFILLYKARLCNFFGIDFEKKKCDFIE